MNILFPVSRFSIAVRNKGIEIKPFMIEKLVGSKTFEIQSALNYTKSVNYWGEFNDDKIIFSRKMDSISTIPPYPTIEVIFSHNNDLNIIDVKCTLSLSWRIIILCSYILCGLILIFKLSCEGTIHDKIIYLLKGVGLLIFIFVTVYSYHYLETRNSKQIIQTIIG